MIAERLKEVREALGFSQQAMADRLGVSLRSQQNYEAGSRTPDATYLAAIAAAGADVLYILTGQRNPAIPVPAPTVSESDRILLDNFHAAPQQVQSGVRTTLGAFAPAAGEKRKKAG